MPPAPSSSSSEHQSPCVRTAHTKVLFGGRWKITTRFDARTRKTHHSYADCVKRCVLGQRNEINSNETFRLYNRWALNELTPIVIQSNSLLRCSAYWYCTVS